MTEILAAHPQDRAKQFLDDLRVKGPKTKYNSEEVTLGIWCYILLEHIQNLDEVLADFECA